MARNTVVTTLSYKHLPRLVHRLGDLIGAGDEVVVLGRRHRDTPGMSLLEGVIADGVGGLDQVGAALFVVAIGIQPRNDQVARIRGDIEEPGVGV